MNNVQQVRASTLHESNSPVRETHDYSVSNYASVPVHAKRNHRAEDGQPSGYSGYKSLREKSPQRDQTSAAREESTGRAKNTSVSTC